MSAVQIVARLYVGTPEFLIGVPCAAAGMALLRSALGGGGSLQPVVYARRPRHACAMPSPLCPNFAHCSWWPPDVGHHRAARRRQMTACRKLRHAAQLSQLAARALQYVQAGHPAMKSRADSLARGLSAGTCSAWRAASIFAPLQAAASTP